MILAHSMAAVLSYRWQRRSQSLLDRLTDTPFCKYIAQRHSSGSPMVAEIFQVDLTLTVVIASILSDMAQVTLTETTDARKHHGSGDQGGIIALVALLRSQG
jgi:hypothetical protein